MAAIALNFLIPAASYVVDRGTTEAAVDQLNQLLGGSALPPDGGHLWHMLAVGNVATLGVMCAMLWADVRRFHPMLPALLFLKAFSATYSLWIAATQGFPVFYAVFVLDGTTALAMAWLTERAIDALDGRRPVPLVAQLLLARPRHILDRVRAAGEVGLATPNLWQVFLGTLYMRHRLLFRPNSVGCSERAIRPGWRPRLLAWRPLRTPFLVWERAIAPFDLTGLGLSPERLAQHLTGAHHDGVQFSYDLEILALRPGALLQLRDALVALRNGDPRRAAWLADLCVFDGYHADLLAGVERAIAGDVPTTTDPDITLHGWLAWCARQPASPGAALARWVRPRSLADAPTAG
jgi:hypothetical protein